MERQKYRDLVEKYFGDEDPAELLDYASDAYRYGEIGYCQVVEGK